MDNKITRVERFNALTYAIMRTAEGSEWLDMLKKDFICDSDVAVPGKDQSFAFFREGQNSMIRMIERSAKEVGR